MKKHLTTLAIALIAGAIAAAAVSSLTSPRADQSERVPPTSGIYTGVQFSQLIGDAVRSISTGNKGSSAPANVGGSAVDGLEWIDDTASTWIKKRYVNGGWAVEGAYNSSDSSWAGVIGGGVNSIASATTTDLGSVPQANITITGTTSITSFGSSAPTGIVKIIRFAAALTLTYSSALTVPGGYDLVTAANDRAIVTHLGSGNWEVTQYTRANGVPVDIAAVGKVEFNVLSAAPANYVAGNGQALTRTSYPAYTAKVTLAQNGTRTSGNATITVASTDGVAAGMPVEGTGINAGCTVSSWAADASITLNSASCVTSSGTSTVSIFLTGYGSGGSATTVGVPDCRGRVMAGMDGGVGRLTSSYFGTYANSINVPGGVESRTLLTANLPPYTPSGSIVSTPNLGSAVTGNAGPGNAGSIGQLGNSLSALTVSSTFTGTAQGGTSTPVATVQPTLTARCVVRVTP